MREIADVTSIIEQYAKHDWVVRRVMLTSVSISSFGSGLESLYPDVEVIESGNEGIWFSRRTLPDREAWELRRLAGSPFALVAILEDSFSAEEQEDVLRSTEQRMFDGSHREPTSH